MATGSTYAESRTGAYATHELVEHEQDKLNY